QDSASRPGHCWTLLRSRTGYETLARGVEAGATLVPVPKRVLVVDDEPDLRTLLRFMLELDARCGSIAEAGDAETAVREAERVAPNAVILDFMLGDATAAEMLPDLRAACPDAKI